jgi:hypothetical protein
VQLHQFALCISQDAVTTGQMLESHRATVRHGNSSAKAALALAAGAEDALMTKKTTAIACRNFKNCIVIRRSLFQMLVRLEFTALQQLMAMR